MPYNDGLSASNLCFTEFYSIFNLPLGTHTHTHMKHMCVYTLLYIAKSYNFIPWRYEHCHIIILPSLETAVKWRQGNRKELNERDKPGQKKHRSCSTAAATWHNNNDISWEEDKKKRRRLIDKADKKNVCVLCLLTACVYPQFSYKKKKSQKKIITAVAELLHRLLIPSELKTFFSSSAFAYSARSHFLLFY